MSIKQEDRVYKILSSEDWRTAQPLGHSKTALDEGDGYVHLSTRDQVAETLHLHYPGRQDTRLLEYDLAVLGGALKWEESRGGQLFPHLYAPLHIDLANRVWTLSLDANDVPALPVDIDS